MIVFKIIRNVALGLFMMVSGWNVLQTENAKAYELSTRFTEVEKTVVAYEVKRIPTTYGSKVRGFFTTSDGDTYLCDDTYDLKKDRTESYKQGPVSFWVMNGSRDNMIYQMKTPKGMVLTYLDTMNSEAPKPMGAYILMGVGLLFSVLGLAAAFYYNKEKTEKSSNI